MDFTANRLTPRYRDFARAIDLMAQMDHDGGLILATSKSDFSSKPRQKAQISKDVTLSLQPPPEDSNSLNLYLSEKGAGARSNETGVERSLKKEWSELQSIYSGTQPQSDGKDLAPSGLLSRIELRTTPRPTADMPQASLQNRNLAPVLRTRSALGVLKYLVDQPSVSFVSEADYRGIARLPWNDPRLTRQCGIEYYVLDTAKPSGWGDMFHEARTEAEEKNDDVVMSYLKTTSSFRQCALSLPENKDVADQEIRLHRAKRHFLIVTGGDEVRGCFTQWESGATRYCIKDDDVVSQRNLMLLSQILTIQATSTPSPALSTVSVR